MPKDAYFFSHDTNARTDPKIMAMLFEHKAQGYGLYWTIIEMLSEHDGYKLRRNKMTYNAIAMAMLCDTNSTENFVNSCIHEYELFDADEEYFWSESLNRRMKFKDEKTAKRAEAGKKGAEIRWKNDKNKQTDSNAMANVSQPHGNAIAKDSKQNETKQNETKNIYSTQAEELWRLYPSKTGKGRVVKKIPKLIEKEGYDQLVRCIDRYKQTKEDWKQWQNGSTFFTSGYIDYLDINYVEPSKNGLEEWLNG